MSTYLPFGQRRKQRNREIAPVIGRRTERRGEKVGEKGAEMEICANGFRVEKVKNGGGATWRDVGPGTWVLVPRIISCGTAT
ncbi:hypothetical protein SLE2022_146640 [Rubroshorea leprosula]